MFTSYLVLGLSPVAAIALTMPDVGAVGPHTAYSIVVGTQSVGSRIGVSLVVVLIGFVYIRQDHDRGTGLLMRILALIIAVSVYLFALPLGLMILNTSLGAVRVEPPIQTGLASAFDVVSGPLWTFRRFGRANPV